jgi:hypothetical protein
MDTPTPPKATLADLRAEGERLSAREAECRSLIQELKDEITVILHRRIKLDIEARNLTT